MSSYATLDQLKRYLDIDLSSEDDGLMQFFLDAGKTHIDSYTHRAFSVDFVTAKAFYGGELSDCGSFLYWWNEDLAELQDVVWEHCNSTDCHKFLTAPRRNPPFYGVEFCEPLHFSSCGCGKNCSNQINVFGKWGYSVTPPHDIVMANLRLAAWLYRQKDSSVDISSVVSSANGVLVLPSRVANDVYQYLSPYVKVVG